MTFTWRKLQSTLSTRSVTKLCSLRIALTLLVFKHRSGIDSLGITLLSLTFLESIAVIVCVWLLLSVLRFFLEYQWLVDFAVYATGVFLFTECYCNIVDASKEVNLGAIWCVLTVLFSVYPSKGTRSDRPANK